MGKNNQNSEDKAARRAAKQDRRAARRAAQMQFNPAFNELDRQMEQFKSQLQNQQLGGQSIFGGTGEILEGLPEQYQNMAGGYPDRYQQDVAEMASLVNPGGMPGGEVAAATDMFNTGAANHLAEFSSNAQRMQGHNESAQRENQLSNRYFQLNLQDAAQEKIQQYENQRQRLMENMGLAQKSELDSIREEAAFQQLIRDLTSGYSGGNNGGGNNGDGDTTGTTIYNDPGNPTNDRAPSGEMPGWYDAASWSDIPQWLQNAMNYSQSNLATPPYGEPSKQQIIQSVPKGQGRRRWLKHNWDEFLERVGPLTSPASGVAAQANASDVMSGSSWTFIDDILDQLGLR